MSSDVLSSGSVAFTADCHNTNKRKGFHLNLYSGHISQRFANGNKHQDFKTFMCSDVKYISTSINGMVQLETKKSPTAPMRKKRYTFESTEKASKFKRYIEMHNQMSAVINNAFYFLSGNANEDGKISKKSLVSAFKKVDLIATDEDFKQMMNFNCKSNDGFYDFYSFFHLFWDTTVYSTRDCLEEWLFKTRTAVNKSLLKVKDELNSLLPGEEFVAMVTNSRWTIGGTEKVSLANTKIFPGSIFVTNYRIILTNARKALNDMQERHSRYRVPCFFDLISAPLASVQKVGAYTSDGSVQISVKDTRVITIYLSDSDRYESKEAVLSQTIRQLAFRSKEGSPKKLFFAYKSQASLGNLGWNYSNISQEYSRQGLCDCNEWRVIDNSAYTFVDTYPKHFVVPALLSDTELAEAANYRSKSRLPAVTYRHRRSGAVLARSAQPLVGLNNKSCHADEKLLNLYRTQGIAAREDASAEGGDVKFYILDARRMIAAALNQAAGKGTEKVSSYTNAEMIYCNIDNIHVMRTSMQMYSEVLFGESDSGSEGRETAFYSRLESSGWLHHVRQVMLAGVLAAEKLHVEGCSVLVHCSDGWDRTAQICSVAQLLLDPFYRTIDGLAVLVEKDWCSFGHKFDDRCGHGQDHSHRADERSPVFVQFLDVLFQVLSQFPASFEYNDFLLLFLADHLFSGLFGNFLGNSDKIRTSELDVQNRTNSIWSYVLANKESFANRNFAAHSSPVWPSPAMSKITVWQRYFSRWRCGGHPNCYSGLEWHDDWGNCFETKAQSARGEDTAYRFKGIAKEDFRSNQTSVIRV